MQGYIEFEIFLPTDIMRGKLFCWRIDTGYMLFLD